MVSFPWFFLLTQDFWIFQVRYDLWGILYLVYSGSLFHVLLYCVLRQTRKETFLSCHVKTGHTNTTGIKKMKEENKKALNDFLSRAEDMGDDILNDAQEMFGSMPFILPVLRERAEIFTLSTLAEERVCRPENLSAKTAELVSVAAAAATGAEYCLKVHIRGAMKEGASRNEIFDAIMIAALVGKTRVLATALREMDDVIPHMHGIK